MGDWQLSSNSFFDMVGTTNSAVLKQFVPSDGVANAKGNYVEIEDSTEVDASAITLMCNKLYGATDYLFDLAIGGSGSEQVILENISISHGQTTYGPNMPFSLRIPISIPSGTRLAGRCQGSGTSTSRYMQCGVILESNTEPKGSHLITVGADTSDSGGVSIDPGGVSYTKGAYTQITASLDKDIKAAFFCFGNRANTSRAVATFLVDIAIGALDSEEIIIPDLAISTDSNADGVRPCHTPTLGISIPAGTRVSARAACDITDATDRLFDIVMYGIA